MQCATRRKGVLAKKGAEVSEGGRAEMIARGNRARRWEPPVFPSRKVISSWRVGGHAIASYTWKSRGRRSELKANRSSASGRVKDYLSESRCCGRESSARPWSSLPVKKSAHRPRAIGEGPPRSREGGGNQGCHLVSLLPIKRMFINDYF